MNRWKAPDKIWAFEPDIFDDCSVWQNQPSPIGNTKEYILMDAHRAQMEAAVKRALEAAADCLRELSVRFDYDLDDEIQAVRQLDPAQFIDGEK